MTFVSVIRMTNTASKVESSDSIHGHRDIGHPSMNANTSE